MQHIRIALVVIAVVGAILPAAVRAGENERQKIIIEMFEVMQYEKIIEQIAAVVDRQITAGVRKKTPDIPSNILSDIDTIAQEEFSKLAPEMMKFTGDFMAENFTETELAELLKFYKSPTGRKSTLVMPQMMQQMMAWVPKVSQKFAQQTMTRVAEMLRSKGYEL